MGFRLRRTRSTDGTFGRWVKATMPGRPRSSEQEGVPRGVRDSRLKVLCLISGQTLRKWQHHRVPCAQAPGEGAGRPEAAQRPAGHLVAWGLQTVSYTPESDMDVALSACTCEIPVIETMRGDCSATTDHCDQMGGGYPRRYLDRDQGPGAQTSHPICLGILQAPLPQNHPRQKRSIRA